MAEINKNVFCLYLTFKGYGPLNAYTFSDAPRPSFLHENNATLTNAVISSLFIFISTVIIISFILKLACTEPQKNVCQRVLSWK